MNEHDLLEAVGRINEKYINNAGNVKTKKKHGYIKWLSVAVAGLFLIVAAGIMIPKIMNHDGNIVENLQDGNNLTVVDNPDDKNDMDRNEQANEAAKGVYIPAIELPNSTDIGDADMIGLIVYQGHIYTQAENYLGEDAHRIELLVGEHLGTAKGNIDEWSSQDKYATEFASTISGEVYTVNGYDDSFRICIKGVVEDENHNRVLWIEFYDCLNDITVAKGRELFEDRLHISERIETVKWQSYHDWNDIDGDIQNIQEADIDPNNWEDFWNQLDDNALVNTWNPDNNKSDPAGNNVSIYDTRNQTHLILSMNDGTVVKLRLIEGGYVGYDYLGWYFVKIQEDVFNAIYDVCGGTH